MSGRVVRIGFYAASATTSHVKRNTSAQRNEILAFVESPAARMVVLGGPSIDRKDSSTKPSTLPGGRAELVFAYLAVEHARTVSRDELANALWPRILPDSWAAALRSVVTEVRHFLDDAGLPGNELITSGRWLPASPESGNDGRRR
jgi:two-component SAPR family response regulator